MEPCSSPIPERQRRKRGKEDARDRASLRVGFWHDIIIVCIAAGGSIVAMFLSFARGLDWYIMRHGLRVIEVSVILFMAPCCKSHGTHYEDTPMTLCNSLTG